MAADIAAIEGQLARYKDEVFFSCNVDRYDKKKSGDALLVITRHRLVALKGKVLKDAHLLDLSEINSPSKQEVRFVFKGANSVEFDIASNDVDDIINNLRKSLHSLFPHLPESQAPLINVQPDYRVQDLPEVPTANDTCGGLAASYVAMCDYHSVQPREDIYWDMKNVLPSSNVKTFSPMDFEQPLTANDARSLFAALKYNRFFHSVNCKGFVFDKNSAGSLGSVISSNTYLSELVLDGCGLTKDTIGDLASALGGNKQTCINKIRLRDNPIGDAGITALGQGIGAMPRGLIVLDVSNCNAGKSGMAAFANGIRKNIHLTSSLSELYLDSNKMESEGSSALASWLANPNCLKVLSLNNTTCQMDSVLGATVRGCQELAQLHIAGNKISKKEVPHLVRLLQSSATLVHLNCSNMDMKVDMMKDIMQAVVFNIYMQNVHINISENKGLGQQGGSLLANIIGDAKNIHTLDVTDCELGDEGVNLIFEKLQKNNVLSCLKIGKNFSTKPSKVRSQLVDQLINVVSSSNISSLCMEGSPKSQLKGDIISFLYSLATNDKLEHLDVSGHGFGNKGANSIGKALQTNKTMHSLCWDGNDTTTAGFAAFAKGMKKNFTLNIMPIPVLDISNCLKNEPQITKYMIKIQNLLARNAAPQKGAFKKKKKKDDPSNSSAPRNTNLTILSSGEREQVERLRFNIKSTGKKLNEEQEQVLRDVENNDSVLMTVHSLEDEHHILMSQTLQDHMKTVAEQMIPVVEEQYQALVRAIMDYIGDRYPSLERDTIRRLQVNMSFGGKQMDTEAVTKILNETVKEISQAAQLSLMSAVTITSDYLYEKLGDKLREIIDDLEQSDAYLQTEPMIEEYKVDTLVSDDNFVMPASPRTLQSSGSSSSLDSSRGASYKSPAPMSPPPAAVSQSSASPGGPSPSGPPNRAPPGKPPPQRPVREGSVAPGVPGPSPGRVKIPAGIPPGGVAMFGAPGRGFPVLPVGPGALGRGRGGPPRPTSSYGGGPGAAGGPPPPRPPPRNVHSHFWWRDVCKEACRAQPRWRQPRAWQNSR